MRPSAPDAPPGQPPLGKELPESLRSNCPVAVTIARRRDATLETRRSPTAKRGRRPRRRSRPTPSCGHGAHINVINAKHPPPPSLGARSAFDDVPSASDEVGDLGVSVAYLSSKINNIQRRLINFSVKNEDVGTDLECCEGELPQQILLSTTADIYHNSGSFN